MACRSLRGGEVFVHVFFVFRLLCILPVCFVAFRPLIYLCSFIKKNKKKFDKDFHEYFELLGIVFKNVPCFLISRSFGPHFMHYFNYLLALLDC